MYHLRESKQNSLDQNTKRSRAKGSERNEERSLGQSEDQLSDCCKSQGDGDRGKKSKRRRLGGARMVDGWWEMSGSEGNRRNKMARGAYTPGAERR
ncbi:hypothetical protein K0M31_007692 [Melipona bicolor]|uniref:Uncharacterized protein n=1 Tax=Melipona bicolor TaxID=60889 RepID=A0AA40KW15_9HYME|nr:hypothetical protein K0M31_007692 [Melipona bicolor]